jgi:hypothetical protein
MWALMLVVEHGGDTWRGSASCGRYIPMTS